jgi:hypothetical protein
VAMKKLAIAGFLAASTLLATGGVAAASDHAPQGYWKVFASYPRTPQGWDDCYNAALNVAKGHCKINSETGKQVFLWGWVS